MSFKISKVNNNISVTKDDNFSITVKLTDAGIQFEAGDTVTFTVKSALDSSVLIQDIVTSFTTEGWAIISVKVDANIGTYYYDIQWEKASGDIHTIIPSNPCLLTKFSVCGEVTT